MSNKIDLLVKQISQLKVTELRELIKALGEFGKPQERSTKGAKPKKPKPTLNAGATEIPPVEKAELISVISKKIGYRWNKLINNG